MLAQLLTQGGIGARTVPRQAIAGRQLGRLERSGIALICLSYVNPEAAQHAQRMVRRLRQHFGPDVRVLLGMWSRDPSANAPQALLQTTGADIVVTSLRQAIREIVETGPEGAEAPRSETAA